MCSGLEVIVVRSHLRLLPDAMPPAEGGQRRIGHIGATTDQFFMDPDEIAFAGGQQF